MPRIANRSSPRNRRVGLGLTAMLAAVMWHAASRQFTGGMIDLVVFAPPGAALGVAATWSAHAFVPDRFTWRRGLVGATVGGVVVSPLIAFLVAFTAAWDPASFQFVFNVGAWLALAGGLGVGAAGWVVAWMRGRLRVPRELRGGRSKREPSGEMPDARRVFHPTRHPRWSRYSVR